MNHIAKVFGGLSIAAGIMWGQADPGPRPGPRPGPPLSGGPISGLSTSELAIFTQGKNTFSEVDDVSKGLGPRFNSDSCASCHAHPAIGGSTPPVNPQIAVATRSGALNNVPPFLQPNGPVRVVRPRSTGGGVRNLFVITGRSDAPEGCHIQQPDFSNPADLTFRIPTPTFGLGLVEAISDSTLKANLAADLSRKSQLGIQGRFNTSANDGTITRFGWKAQNKSLAVFSGEAYNVEVGVTNELFPQEREEDPACATNPLIESSPDVQSGSVGDVELFSMFMRYLAAPTPARPNPSINRGRQLLDAVGCTLCHTPALQSGRSTSAALDQQTVALFSDLALHRMGPGLADGITQGAARGDEWRTAPLWGLGDRLFFLHDGRTSDLLEAIRQHDSPGSEATQVIRNFGGLPPEDKQALVNFLRSL